MKAFFFLSIFAIGVSAAPVTLKARDEHAVIRYDHDDRNHMYEATTASTATPAISSTRAVTSTRPNCMPVVRSGTKRALGKKMPRCTGGTICKVNGSYAGCVNGGGDSGYGYKQPPTTTEDSLLSSITQQPTTTPSDHYEDNDDKAPCTNSDEYRCSDVDVQQCGYVAGPKLVWLTLDTCNAGTCGPLANVGCPQEKAK
ncbi:hypothetical protein BC830DRAFT_1167544 [Chytriomyces sp. MP71]|nr:hypothetical protein BC830DRAFT_1167544 [Chytriomyces sp. MP71]